MPDVIDLRISNIAALCDNEVVLELSDGRVLTFSLEKLLTLEPDETLSDLAEKQL